MSHKCHNESCSHESHEHSKHSCDCCCHRECDCPCHHRHAKYSDQLLELADEAWMELVKEKIKEDILKHSGDHITKLAQLASRANHKRWNEKLSEKKNHDDFDDQLQKLITSGGKK